MKTTLLLFALALASCASQRDEIFTGGGGRLMPAGTIDEARGAHNGRLGEYDAVAQKIVGKSGRGAYSEWTLPPRGIQQRYTGRAKMYVWRHQGSYNWHAVREVDGEGRNYWQGGTPAPGFYSARRMEEVLIPANR